jgi:DNA-binding response OmpR family regulator
MANILIVDDEPDVLNALARALKLAGHSVKQAASAADAIAMSADHMFDLVVLDYIMPEMTGIALLNELRGCQATIRSIVVSGKIDSEVSEEEIGVELRDSIEADVYLHKPLDNAKLVDVVRKLLEQSEDRDWKQIADRNLKAKKKSSQIKRAEKGMRHHRR